MVVVVNRNTHDQGNFDISEFINGQFAKHSGVAKAIADSFEICEGQTVFYALLKFSFGLKQFLLLLHCLLHDFSALEELTLHVFDFFEKFLLIRLFFLLFSVLFFKLRNQTLSFLFCELVLLLNPQFLLFKFLHDCAFFSFQLILHRFHLFFVFNVNSSFNFHYAAGARHSAGTALCSHSASSHLRKLLSQPRDFVVELADHCVFRIFVDSGLILNLLGARSIS